MCIQYTHGCISTHPASPDDFLYYDKLMNYLYRPLGGIAKKNHICSCMDDGSQMRLWQSNLEEHNKLVFNLWKRTTSKKLCAKIAEISNSVLVTITNDGLNPYKVVVQFQESGFVRVLIIKARCALLQILHKNTEST